VTPKDVQFVFDGSHLGELIAHVIVRHCQVEGIDTPADEDEWREIMQNAFDYCAFMADRATMYHPDALADLHALPEVPEPDVTAPRVTSTHLPEFGGVAPKPFGFDPPV
jgi:hypothetical protein